MAVVKNLMVRAGADFSAITKQANKASKSMNSMQRSVSSSCNAMTASLRGLKSLLGAAGVALSVGALVSAAKDAKEAFEQQAAAEAKLGLIMRNTMGASEAEIQSIKDLAAAQQALGVVGDDVTEAGAQQLAVYLKQTSSLQKLIPAMNDLAVQQNGYNVTAEHTTAVAKTLGKVMEGQTGALKRMGITVTSAQEAVLKYGTEEQRAALLAEIVEASVGGMNAALAQTPSGQLQQVSNALGDVKENFGGAVTTLLGSFIPAIWQGVNALAKLADFANRVANAIARVFGGGTSGAAAQAASYGSALGSAADSAEDLGKAVGGAGKAAKEAKKTLAGFDELTLLADNSSSGGSGSGKTSASGGGGGGGASIPAPAAGASESWGALERALQKVKDLVGSINFGPIKESFDSLMQAAGRLGGVISDGLGWAFDNVLTPLAHWTVEAFLPALLETLAASFDLLTDCFVALQPAAQWVWDNCLQPLAAWSGDALCTALNAVTDAFRGLSDVVKGDKSFVEWLAELTPLQAIILGVGSALILLMAPINTTALLISGLVLATGYLIKNWDKVKQAAKDVWDEVSRVIGDAIDVIKGLFDFDWQLPHIPLPHFVIDGDFSLIPPVFPSIGVEWYAKGGVVDSAQLIGVGEAGAEAILPLESNTGWMDALADRLSARLQQVSGNDSGGIAIDIFVNGRKMTDYFTVQQRRTARAKG